MNEFSISRRELRPGCQVIEVVGELDLAVADQLKSAIEAVESDTLVVVISLERCEFMDSTGLATILAARQEFEQADRRLVVSAPGVQVKRILSITGLVSDGLVFDSIEEAAAQAHEA